MVALLVQLFSKCSFMNTVDHIDASLTAGAKQVTGNREKRRDKEQITGCRSGAERQILCKTRTPNFNSNGCLIPGLISFRASHLISGRWYPSLLSQELISHSPSYSLLCVCDGVSVTACNAGLYALIIWHPPFRCAIKVPLLSSFLLCRQNNVQ